MGGCVAPNRSTTKFSTTTKRASNTGSRWRSIRSSTKRGTSPSFISIQANIDSVKLSALEFSAKLDAIQRANLTVEFDLAGKVLAANQKLVDAMGLRSQEDLIGRPLDGFLVDPTVMKAVLDDLNRGQATTSEVAFTAGAGEVLWVNIAINPILDLGGRVVRAFGFGEDITPNQEGTREDGRDPIRIPARDDGAVERRPPAAGERRVRGRLRQPPAVDQRLL